MVNKFEKIKVHGKSRPQTVSNTTISELQLFYLILKKILEVLKNSLKIFWKFLFLFFYYVKMIFLQGFNDFEFCTFYTAAIAFITAL